MRLIGASIWHCILPSRREALLAKHAMLAKAWNQAEKKFRQADQAQKESLIFERQWLSSLMTKSLQRSDDFLGLVVRLLIDLESQLPIRRFVSTLVDDNQFLILARQRGASDNLLSLAELMLRFPVEEYTGFAKSLLQMDKEHSFRIVDLQSFLFGHKDLKHVMQELCLASVQSLQTKEQLLGRFDKLSREQLAIICDHYKLRTADSIDEK
jgi:intron-binding protein aquarius